MRISSIVRVSTQGVSRPYVCRDESGGLWWCKGNHTGLRAVMSEWVCANIARAVGLPVPDFAIARFEPYEFRALNAPNGDACPALVTDANPYVFASRHVESAMDVISAEEDLHKIEESLLAKVYLFDSFIRNSDRTTYNSNLLANGTVHIIDHGNAFDSAFDCAAFERDHILKAYFQRTPATLAAAFSKTFRGAVTPSFLETVWSEMPESWTDVSENVFSLRTVKATLLEDVR